MVALKERIPRPLRTPVSLTSFAIGVLGVVLGWIYISLGATLYWDLNGLGDAITGTESLIVLAVGIVFAAVGYVGLKGFMYFSY